MTDDAQHTDRRRFEVLCTPLSADLFRFVYWLCRDRALAEDVVQETLLRAWRSIGSLSEESAARAWLLTIARRELARVFERKRLDTIEIDAANEMQPESLAVDDPYDVHETRRAILHLDVIYREPLILQVLFGYSTDEIARHLQISVPAVLTRLHRARRLLRRQLLPHADDGSSPDEL